MIFIIGAVITRQLTNCKPDDKLSSSASAKEAISVSVLHPFISCAKFMPTVIIFLAPHRTCLFIFQLDMDNFLQIVLPVNLWPFPKIWHVFLFYALTYEFLLFFTTLFDFYIFSKRLYENNNAKGSLMAECFSFATNLQNLLSIELNRH